MLTKCNSCGGSYSSFQPDGSRYFHACSPEAITPSVCDPKTGEVQTPEVRSPRVNPRNENLKQNPDKPTEFSIISEGAGVTEVA